MIEALKNLDIRILLFVNGHHNPFWDRVMWFASAKSSWFPLYALLIALVIWKLKKKAIPLLLGVALLILCSDQLASGILKPLVARPRPSHQPGLENLLHYVNGYQGGAYGFVSSHAANTFSLCFYFLFSFRRQALRWLGWVLLPWASFVVYSRMYLGVHYPSDILVPILFSIPLGYGFARLYRWSCRRFFPPQAAAGGPGSPHSKP